MAKNGEVIPKDVPERYTWKCDLCSVKGKAATKREAQLARALHKTLAH